MVVVVVVVVAVTVVVVVKLRHFIERGRLDVRFPITQRHLLESKCMTRIKHGVALFNVNDYPFPYRINIEVAGADQSSVMSLSSLNMYMKICK